jgi:hypothetical protein
MGTYPISVSTSLSRPICKHYWRSDLALPLLEDNLASLSSLTYSLLIQNWRGRYASGDVTLASTWTPQYTTVCCRASCAHGTSASQRDPVTRRITERADSGRCIDNMHYRKTNQITCGIEGLSTWCLSSTTLRCLRFWLGTKRTVETRILATLCLRREKPEPAR